MNKFEVCVIEVYNAGLVCVRRRRRSARRVVVVEMRGEPKCFQLSGHAVTQSLKGEFIPKSKIHIFPHTCRISHIQVINYRENTQMFPEIKDVN